MQACFSTSLSFTWIEDYEFLMEHRLRYAIPWVMPVEREAEILAAWKARAP